jgi:hypothetical protein
MIRVKFFHAFYKEDPYSFPGSVAMVHLLVSPSHNLPGSSGIPRNTKIIKEKYLAC